MATREEIREGIEQGIRLGICAYQHLGFGNPELYSKIAAVIIKRLHSKDVVIKVERELPEFARILSLDRYAEFNYAYIKGQEFERDTEYKAGYVAVEPLIKE